MKGRSLGLVLSGFLMHRSRAPIRCRAHVVFQLHFRDYSLPFTPIVLLACIHVASCSRPAPLHLLSVTSSSRMLHLFIILFRALLFSSIHLHWHRGHPRLE